MRLPLLASLGLLLSPLGHAESLPVTITVDASAPVGELKPIWRFWYL